MTPDEEHLTPAQERRIVAAVTMLMLTLAAVGIPLLVWLTRGSAQ
jgi:hypothetical protein